MIQDPSNRYIDAIMFRYDLNGKDVLEIGCGRGRITRDLAKHARHVVATDPDVVSVGMAQAAISFRSIDFMVADGVRHDLADSRFDVVIYTLSLHHVPAAEMADSLNKAAGRRFHL
jgi:2-polyprenyl-3-methyl-5-hydroxy-6-metoxy-1,4-benzoquinol methylase